MKHALKVGLRGVPAQFRSPDTLVLRLLEQASGRPLVLSRRKGTSLDVAVTSTHLSGTRRLTSGAHLRLAGATAGFPSLKSVDRWDFHLERPLDVARVNLWFSGENLRPPVGDWDLTLSHDVDDFGGTNVYFPYWIEALGIFASPTVNFLGRVQRLEELLAIRRTDWAQREGFVCAFLGKTSGLRMHAIQALSQRGRVEVFGPAVGRPVKDKISIAKNFKFVLCFENDLYPGYVTEKPFDAWGTGAIPLWWGSDPAGYLNTESLLNLAEFRSLQEFVDAVATLASDGDLGQAVSEKPILARAPDMLAIENRVRQALAPVLGDF